MISLSRRFDATREEIVTNFRARINNHKRTKLTKQELEELIEIFISHLQSLNSKQDIQQVCETEIALLEEGYPAASVAKNYLPLYRNAIATAIKEQRVLLNDESSHQYTYIKDGIEHLTTEHWALTYLKYDTASYEQFAEATTCNNNLKQDSLQPVNRGLYLKMVNSLLKSSHPWELAIALAAVTGRRYSEVMAKGYFESTDHPYQISFSGQLKKQDAALDYTIFTLLPAIEVMTALARFRTHPEIAALEDASIEEINQLNTPINRLVKQYFQDSHLVPVLKKEAGVTIQNLRGIYGEIALSFFCPPNVGSHRFIQRKLGHLISASELLKRKNSASTEHYFHYYLCDNNGKLLADKGLLLSAFEKEDSFSVTRRKKGEEGSKPSACAESDRPQTSAFQSKSLGKEPKFNHATNLQQVGSISSAGRTPNKAVPQTMRDKQASPGGNLQGQPPGNPSIARLHPHQNRFLMNQPNSSHSSLEIQAIPPYLHSRLEDISRSLDLSPTEAIEKSFQWAEIGIALAQLLKLESLNPHTLFDRVQALSTAVLEQSNSVNGSNNSAELTAAQEQIVSLTRSLDRITELFYQTNSLSTSQETSSITRGTPSSRRSLVTSNDISTTNSKINRENAQENRRALDNRKSPQDDPEGYAERNRTSSNNARRKRDSSKIVQEDINHAIDAIMKFNDAPARLPEQKFYIGIGSVADLSGRGNAPIKKVLESRKDEIQHHLDQHHLDQNQNLSRRNSQGEEYPTIDREPEIDYHKITQLL